METCLVFGGKGFIGSHLIEALLAEGHVVRCFDRARIPAPVAGDTDANVEHVEGDFNSEVDVSAALQGCTVCYHLVSSTLPASSNSDPLFDIESNLMATVRMLRQAVAAGVRHILFVSSGGTVYGIPKQIPIPESHPTDPVCSYGIVKLAIEKYLALFSHLHGIRTTVLRLANPYGERQRPRSAQGAVAVFLGKALRREPVEIWGDGSVVRDYLHVVDAARALVLALEYQGPERTFNIGSGHGVSLSTLLDEIEALSGRALQRIHCPSRSVDVPVNVLDVSLARAALGWSPRVGFREGLARTYQWMVEQGPTMVGAEPHTR